MSNCQECACCLFPPVSARLVRELQRQRCSGPLAHLAAKYASGTTASGSCPTCGPMAIPRGGFILIGPPMLGCPKEKKKEKKTRM